MVSMNGPHLLYKVLDSLPLAFFLEFISIHSLHPHEETHEQIIIFPMPELYTYLSDLTKMSSQKILSLTLTEIVPSLSIHLD